MITDIGFAGADDGSARTESPPPDLALEEAGKLMESRGIPLARHHVLRENLATYLSHRCFGRLSARWQGKIERDLGRPFLDEALSARVHLLQRSLLENVRELPRPPVKIYITGSFAWGRLGGNSDLDGYALLLPEDVGAAFDLYERRVGDPNASCLFPLSIDRPGFNHAKLMTVGGASVRVDPARLEIPGYLLSIYEQVRSVRPGERRETSAVYEWLISRAWREGLPARRKRAVFEGRTLVSRLANTLLSFAGTAARWPLVGRLVEGCANACVRQRRGRSGGDTRLGPGIGAAGTERRGGKPWHS